MGGPCKPKRQNSSLIGKVASRATKSEIERRIRRTVQMWTNPYPPKVKK